MDEGPLEQLVSAIDRLSVGEKAEVLMVMGDIMSNGCGFLQINMDGSIRRVDPRDVKERG